MAMTAEKASAQVATAGHDGSADSCLLLEQSTRLRRCLLNQTNRRLLAFETESPAAIAKVRIMRHIVMHAPHATRQRTQFSIFRHPLPSMQACILRTLAWVTMPSVPL